MTQFEKYNQCMCLPISNDTLYFISHFLQVTFVKGGGGGFKILKN